MKRIDLNPEFSNKFLCKMWTIFRKYFGVIDERINYSGIEQTVPTWNSYIFYGKRLDILDNVSDVLWKKNAFRTGFWWILIFRDAAVIETV